MAHSLDTMRELADLAEQVARLPDAVNVSAETAALLISVDDPPGPRTMEGWRQGRNRHGETGPPFLTGPGRTSQVLYNVGAVRAWMRSRQVATTMEAAARRGLAFAGMVDLTRPEPWVMRDGLVVGHALTVSDEDLDAALRGVDGISLRIDGLAGVLSGVVWSNPSTCRYFKGIYSAILQQASEDADAVVFATTLQGELPNAAVEEKGRCVRCRRQAHAGDC